MLSVVHFVFYIFSVYESTTLNVLYLPTVRLHIPSPTRGKLPFLQNDKRLLENSEMNDQYFATEAACCKKKKVQIISRYWMENHGGEVQNIQREYDV